MLSPGVDGWPLALIVGGAHALKRAANQASLGGGMFAFCAKTTPKNQWQILAFNEPVIEKVCP